MVVEATIDSGDVELMEVLAHSVKETNEHEGEEEEKGEHGEIGDNGEEEKEGDEIEMGKSDAETTEDEDSVAVLRATVAKQSVQLANQSVELAQLKTLVMSLLPNTEEGKKSVVVEVEIEER